MSKTKMSGDKQEIVSEHDWAHTLANQIAGNILN